jgi:uncharacterized iron-regulated membrane protein
MAGKSTKFRRAFLAMHRWVAIGLFLLLVPVSLSGALLVYHDELDTLLNPARYAISGKEMLPPSAYLKSAAAAVEASPGTGLQVSILRYPESEWMPVTVIARGRPAEGGGPPVIVTIYLDPPSARVLDTSVFRTSFFGFLHRFHENLTIPQYSGRAIVGWVGVAMLLLSLSGIYLWWPRHGRFLPGMRWRRTVHVDNNLHHLLGFWISLPLAFVSLTGIYLSFPPQARDLMSSLVPMTPPAPRTGFGPVARQTALTPDRALATAQAAAPQLRPAALFLPAAAREGATNPSLSWRIQMRSVDDEIATITVDDATGTATRVADPLTGDRAAQWIRRLHEGSHSGAIWRAVVLLTGVFPTVLGVTGIIVWLRRRRIKRRIAMPSGAREILGAAE